MALTDIVTATEAGKIPWRLHDNGNGYWGVIDNSWRLDLVDGQYTLRKDGTTVDKEADGKGDLLAIIEKTVGVVASDTYAEFQAKLTAADVVVDPTKISEVAHK